MKILTYPHPILDQVAAKVNLPLSKDHQELIRQMYQCVQKKGVGLAAPQVGQSLQICIINLSDDKTLAKKYKTPDFVMINPEIIFASQLQSIMVEGCLSFPGQYWKIRRSANISASFDAIANWAEFLQGAAPVMKKQKNLVAKEWLARVILHEVDHLNGQLFINLKGEKLKEEDLGDEKVVE